MCTHARTPSPSGSTLIASSKSRAVGGSIVIASSSSRSSRRPSASRSRETRAGLAQRASAAIRAASPRCSSSARSTCPTSSGEPSRSTTRALPPGLLDDDELAGLHGLTRAAPERELLALVEERLRDEEAPAALDGACDQPRPVVLLAHSCAGRAPRRLRERAAACAPCTSGRMPLAVDVEAVRRAVRRHRQLDGAAAGHRARPPGSRPCRTCACRRSSRACSRSAPRPRSRRRSPSRGRRRRRAACAAAPTSWRVIVALIVCAPEYETMRPLARKTSTVSIASEIRPPGLPRRSSTTIVRVARRRGAPAARRRARSA